MSKSILYGAAGLLIGAVLGFLAANYVNRNAELGAAAAQPQPGPAQQTVVAETSVDGTQADVAEALNLADAEPQNFVAQMKAGDMYARIGRFEKAIEYYRRGLAVKPADFNANLVMANALFDSRQFDEAEVFYTKALLIKPEDVNARTDLGTTFVERSKPDYDRAIKEFNTALAVDPKNEPTLYYLGIAYFRKGDRANAEKALAELEKANPSSVLIGRLRQNMEPQQQ